MQQPPNQPPYPPQQFPPRRPSELAQFIALVRRRPIILIPIIVVALIVLGAVINGVAHGVSQSQQDDATATATADAQQTACCAAPTDVPTQASQATTASTTAPAPPAAIVPTHGSPHLGGNISDFYGKYGHTMNPPSAGSSPSNRPSMSVGWLTDSNNGYLLGVQYYADTHIVYYISYVGPSNWSKAQYRDYLIANFAPPGTAINAQTNHSWASTGGDPYNPIAYDSSIGKFFLHISDGTGNMNTV